MKNYFWYLLLFGLIPNLALAQNKEPWQKKYVYSQWDTNEILAATDKKGKAGYITSNGEVAIPFIYERSLPFNADIGNLGFVKKNKKWGAIDMKGVQKIEHLYDDVDFLRNVIRVKKNGKWGAIDTSGSEIVPFIYDKPDFNESSIKNKN